MSMDSTEDFDPKDTSSSRRHLRITESIMLGKISETESNLSGGLVFQILLPSYTAAWSLWMT